jgi:hypothetical protein
MLFRDRPLLPDGLDSELYVARPGLEAEILAPLGGGRNVLLLGEAGAGKSTLLRKVAGELEVGGRPVVLANGALADDASELLELIDVALEERVPSGETDPASDGGPEAARLLRAARRLAREEPAVIMVDDLSSSEIGFDVFGRLRDELWTLGHAWLVAVRPRDSAALRTPPADAFWGRIVEIPPLDYAETEQLLSRGLSEQELQRLDDDRLLSGAHPRFLIRWAQDRLEGGNKLAGGQSRPQWHLEQASRIGRSESMAVAELQGLGRPVSAHDPELLERLGWSRPYAQRILSNLEEHQLLRSIPERRDAPGRPRKLYELNPNPPGR